jgi:hypothetical protein
MSPYLFVLWIDKLSHLISKKRKKIYTWIPMKAGRNRPNISHLMFTDDLPLFGRATTSTMNATMSILNNFCHMFGSKWITSKLPYIYLVMFLFRTELKPNNAKGPQSNKLHMHVTKHKTMLQIQGDTRSGCTYKTLGAQTPTRKWIFPLIIHYNIFFKPP